MDEAFNDASSITVPEPFPINLVANRYLIYDINVVTYIRREHHICGVLIGSLPQFPQQNIFLGLPQELMPEEARLLVDKGAAFVVDDVKIHANRIPALTQEEKVAFMKTLERQGREIARAAEKRAEQKREKALEKHGRKNHVKVLDGRRNHSAAEPKMGEDSLGNEAESENLFAVPDNSIKFKGNSSIKDTEPVPYSITPTTSYQPLTIPQKTPDSPLPAIPSSYPLFKHLHSKNYFISPGLRFGCQYLVYPGDPLRFHSHFLAVSAEWEEELDLLDIIGGGRLGTGVKKGFLIGGVEKNDEGDDMEGGSGKKEERVRTFCIEWGGM
ncbi:MAG: tRNA-splicing endonuclease subunit [Peltula sp. TS41687]|nr:MAG: tRNA-splicing endonuclease subunit [Peltula sp. TS41687]